MISKKFQNSISVVNQYVMPIIHDLKMLTLEEFFKDEQNEVRNLILLFQNIWKTFPYIKKKKCTECFHEKKVTRKGMKGTLRCN